jgi:tellurite resistance protein
MRFSDPGIARLFVRDALMIAGIDGEIHPDEWAWIRAVARKNGLTDREIGDGARDPAPAGSFPKS